MDIVSICTPLMYVLLLAVRSLNFQIVEVMMINDLIAVTCWVRSKKWWIPCSSCHSGVWHCSVYPTNVSKRRFCRCWRWFKYRTRRHGIQSDNAFRQSSRCSNRTCERLICFSKHTFVFYRKYKTSKLMITQVSVIFVGWALLYLRNIPNQLHSKRNTQT